MTGAGLAGASLLGAAGCGGGSGSSGSSGGDMWKQYAGTTLNFVSENTSPTTAIAANLNGFKGLQLTAIGTVVVLPMMIIGLAVRRYLVRGLPLGAVTGE
jgi:hypothetical protein